MFGTDTKNTSPRIPKTVKVAGAVIAAAGLSIARGAGIPSELNDNVPVRSEAVTTTVAPTDTTEVPPTTQPDVAVGDAATQVRGHEQTSLPIAELQDHVIGGMIPPNPTNPSDS